MVHFTRMGVPALCTILLDIVWLCVAHESTGPAIKTGTNLINIHQLYYIIGSSSANSTNAGIIWNLQPGRAWPSICSVRSSPGFHLVPFLLLMASLSMPAPGSPGSPGLPGLLDTRDWSDWWLMWNKLNLIHNSISAPFCSKSLAIFTLMVHCSTMAPKWHDPLVRSRRKIQQNGCKKEPHIVELDDSHLVWVGRSLGFVVQSV